MTLSYRDRAVFLPESQTVVVADLHLGRSRTAAFESPLDTVVDLAGRLEEIVCDTDATTVVIAGDCLDAFGRVPPGVTDRFFDLRDRLDVIDVDLHIVGGNHDTMLTSLVDVDIPAYLRIDDTVICHGHTIPDITAERYILGHEHPTLRVDGIKEPCFLHGHEVFEGADVLVLPAFSTLVRGTAFNSHVASDCHAPLVRSTDLDLYRPILVADPTLRFPPLGELRPHL